MTRGGRKKVRDEPERRCIATGETQPKRGMIRFVVGPDGGIVPDILEKLPRRGIWVSADHVALKTAIKKGLFSRAAKAPVTVSDDLLTQVEQQLARHVIDLVSMSRKSGSAVAGYEKVKAWLTSGRARVLMQATDGSARGKTKFWMPEGGQILDVLSASELGLAFGRESVIHGALAAGGLTFRVVEEATRLSGLRGHGGKDTAERFNATI